jgi:DNA-binding NarL/FixJ family response regulator
VVGGATNPEIAEALGISARTVQGHIAACMRKTRTRSRTQLAVYALRIGLVDGQSSDGTGHSAG